MKAPFFFDDIFGYEEIKGEARKLARIDENILLIGESGVGKKVFASSIHNESRRKDKPFVIVESPSVQSPLFESELFGHKKGAFTDAKEDRAGLIEIGDGGTVFFDEIGELPLELQPKLLRVIEERRVRRIGENIERKVDVRFIFATNKDLWKEAKLGRFRKDLLQRIETFVLFIPPFRTRKEKEEILRGIWNRIVGENSQGSNFNSLNDEEISLLLDYDFPGNIRQIEKILKRVFHFSDESSKRIEVIEREMERERRRWEGNEDWYSKRLYNQMKGRKINFWNIRDKYLAHELNKYQLEEIISYGLEEGDGTLKGLLPIFGIEERDYKRFLNFLNAQGIKLKTLKNSDQSQNHSDYSQKK